MFKALLAAQNPKVLGSLAGLLEPGASWTFAQGEDECFAQLEREAPDLLFIQLSMIDGVASTLRDNLTRLRRQAPATVFFVLCPQDQTIDSEAFQTGGVHFLRQPIRPEQAGAVVNQILRARHLKSELDHCKSGFLPADSSDMVAFSSPKMQRVLERARAVAGMDSTVLLTGETGTGKGVLARIIHCWSRRRDRPFVAVQCSAIPETLLESDLFGHEKGAFTDAVRTKPGRFDAARGGTLFLDEIATIPPATQIKLLQVLQEKTYQRVGGEETFSADVRILAATNSDLRKEISRGAFRADLYYRLNVFPIQLPALRDRAEDIPALAHVFLKKLNRAYGKGVLTIDPSAMPTLQTHSWPGNIRELENLIERAYILANGPSLTLDELNLDGEPTAPPTASDEPIDTSLTLQAVRDRCVREAERVYLVELLRRHQGRINETAAAAGVGVRQLHKLLARHQIRKEDFKPIKDNRNREV